MIHTQKRDQPLSSSISSVRLHYENIKVFKKKEASSQDKRTLLICPRFDFDRMLLRAMDLVPKKKKQSKNQECAHRTDYQTRQGRISRLPLTPRSCAHCCSYYWRQAVDRKRIFFAKC